MNENGVDFLEDNEFHIRSRRILGEPETPTMVKFLLNTGLAKDEKQALWILIAVIVVIVATTVWLARGDSVRYTDPVITSDGTLYTVEEIVRELKNKRNPF